MDDHTCNSSNRLDAETSPYLLQHADNPVAWQPWDDEALRSAREQDKPILLSIGYSACHWCHVMAHESFEDDETAELMNRLYVNIKIDREERPDLDKVYQAAHQLLARRPGGWPLTVFLTPDDLTPFFAATYFPREPRFGMPGFKDVLHRIHAAYTEQRDQIRAQNAELRKVFETLSADDAGTGATFDNRPFDAARRALETDFDADNGGFGGAPKFPHPTNIEFLLRQSQLGDGAPAGRMALFSLRKMAERGLYDQLGGGFFRYCVDAEWEIPHFEKMLYDNGPLLALYADATALDEDREFARIVTETADWAIRDMQSPDGGFYSTLDADTAGHEGGTYVWDREDVRAALAGHPEASLLEELLTEHFGLDGEPNFEDVFHLHVARSVEDIAKERNLPDGKVRGLIDAARDRLLEARQQRAQPGRDEKIIASWNGLMIRGLARASRRVQRMQYANAATRAVDFLRARLWQDGRLLAVYKDGRSRFNAYLDDHAFLLDALLELLQCRWRDDDLQFARQLADALLERFEDKDNGGFFFTSHDHEALIHRPKPFADEATPSGNGVAAAALIRLGHLVGEERYLKAAERCLQSGWESIGRAPHAHAAMLEALREWLHPGETVILRGDTESMQSWQVDLELKPRFDRMMFAIPEGAAGLPETLAMRKPLGDCVAYVCEGFECSPPITSREEINRRAGTGPG